MKKLLYIIISLTLFSLPMVSCAKTKEIIKISKSGSQNIKTIDTESKVNEIKSILSYIEYSENTMDLDLDNPDYKLWLEDSNSDKRAINLKLWYDPNSTNFIVFKVDTNEVGFLTDIERDKFTTILSGIK